MASESGLRFYWIETRPHEVVGKHWGQLAGATHRLRFVIDMLEELVDEVNTTGTENTITRLEYHAENYYSRVYELRERAIGLTASICGNAALARELKSQKRRAAALSDVERDAPHLLSSIRNLLACLDEDIGARNFHTHDTFLRLGLWTEHDVYDPVDALNDLHHEPLERAWLDDLLRAEAKKLAEEYRNKAQQIIEAVFNLLRDSERESRWTSTV